MTPAALKRLKARSRALSRTCDICDTRHRLHLYDGRTLCEPCRRVEKAAA